MALELGCDSSGISHVAPAREGTERRHGEGAETGTNRRLLKNNEN